MATFSEYARFVLGFVFLSSGWPKLRAPGDFKEAVQNYQIGPRVLSSLVGTTLPSVEVVIALMLLAGIFASLASFVATGFLLMFISAASINLVRGRVIDCGCAGSISPKHIGWGRITRDAVLLALAAAFAWHTASGAREIVSPLGGDPWRFSGIEIIPVALTAWLIVASEQLVEEGRRFLRLRLEVSRRVNALSTPLAADRP